MRRLGLHAGMHAPAIRSTFNYVDQVQTTASSSNTLYAQAPTVSQRDETVGTFLTLLPTAKSDATIFLSVSLDVTNLQSLVPFTVGGGGTAVTVQQKTIDGTGVIQEVPIRSGQSVVIGGLESTLSKDQVRRLAPDAPILLGGSNAASQVRTRTLLIVTAVAEDSITH